LGLPIDFEDLALDLLAFLDDVFDLIDLVVGQFGDVDQAFDAWCQADESAELSNSGDRTFDRCPNGKSLLNVGPRMLFGVLQRQADLAGRFVNLFDTDSHLLAFLDDFTRMLHAVPGELADMNQPINTTQIDECTEVMNLADRPFTHLSR